MSKIYSNYDRVKRFIKNEPHIELTVYQEQQLKYMLDEQTQEYLKQLYKDE